LALFHTKERALPKYGMRDGYCGGNRPPSLSNCFNLLTIRHLKVAMAKLISIWSRTNAPRTGKVLVSLYSDRHVIAGIHENSSAVCFLIAMESQKPMMQVLKDLRPLDMEWGMYMLLNAQC
jgi:hypothetical protein